MRSALEGCDFGGKTLIPFATSGGSGMGKIGQTLSPLCGKAAEWKSGKLVNRMGTAEFAQRVRSLDL